MSRRNLERCDGKLTEDDRNDDGLNIDCARLVGVSREICNVQAQGGVITQYSVEIYEGAPVSKQLGMTWIIAYSRKTPRRARNRG